MNIFFVFIKVVVFVDTINFKDDLYIMKGDLNFNTDKKKLVLVQLLFGSFFLFFFFLV